MNIVSDMWKTICKFIIVIDRLTNNTWFHIQMQDNHCIIRMTMFLCSLQQARTFLHKVNNSLDLLMSKEKSNISSGILSSTKEEGNSVNDMDEPQRQDGK